MFRALSLIALIALIALSGCVDRIVDRNCPFGETAPFDTAIDFNLIEIVEGSGCEGFRLFVPIGESDPYWCEPIEPVEPFACGASFWWRCSGDVSYDVQGWVRIDSLREGPTGEALVRFRSTAPSGGYSCEGVYEVDAWPALPASGSL